MAELNKKSHLILYRKYSGKVKYILMVLCVAIITFFLPKQARFRYEYEKGKTWLQKDLVAPFSFAILKTSAEIQKNKDELLESVQPAYQNDQDVEQKQFLAFETDFNIKWKNSLVPETNKETYFNIGKSILEHVYQKGIISLVKKYQKNNPEYNFTLLSNNIAYSLNTLDVFTAETALRFANNELDENSKIQNKSWLLTIIEDHIEPNYVYDERFTDKLEADAISNISTTRGMVQKGEVIITKTETINSEAYQKLESLRAAFEEDARSSGDRKQILLGQFLLVGMVISLMVSFLYVFRRDIFYDNRKLSLILIIVTGILILLSWAIKIKIPTVYYIPYCIVPIIIRILFDTRLALNIHLLVVLIGGFFVPNSFEFAFLEITAGMVAIYSIKNLIKREQFLISALLILSSYFIGFLGIALIKSGSVYDIEWSSFSPFIFSVLLSLLAYPLIYVFEKVFGITSDLSLIELTNTNSKLLRELAFRAPGTFQHSMQVANLAEAAIFKIGGNALLVRAGALYHDIGKMQNPQYFIENQNTGANPHDNLPYEQSAQLIIQHVNNGIALAKKHLIPEIVIDFIRTHHGTTRVDYFYQSFLKNFPEKFVDENIFRYPGPIPFSKETAVLMLADSVEAASRGLKNPNVKSLSTLVDRIVDYKLEQNQLKDSDITLKDIETIKLIFNNMLMSIYHVRVDYDDIKVIQPIQ